MEKYATRLDGAKHHDLKILTDYYFEVLSGRKKFEIRKNDRDFRRNDIIKLRAFDPEKGYVKLPEIHAYISYVTDYAQQEGYVVFSVAGQRTFDEYGNATF